MILFSFCNTPFLSVYDIRVKYYDFHFIKDMHDKK